MHGDSQLAFHLAEAGVPGKDRLWQPFQTEEWARFFPVVIVDMCRNSGLPFAHQDDDIVALFDEGVLPSEMGLFV